MSVELSRSCLLGLIVIAISCFLLGFLLEIAFLHIHHDKEHNSAPGLRARIDIQTGKGSQISSDELDRLLRLDELYTTQLQELDRLRSQLSDGKVSVNSAPKTDFAAAASAIVASPTDLDKDGITNVPNVVKAWRTAKLDWWVVSCP
jgi:hypothetical protein